MKLILCVDDEEETKSMTMKLMSHVDLQRLFFFLIN